MPPARDSDLPKFEPALRGNGEVLGGNADDLRSGLGDEIGGDNLTEGRKFSSKDSAKVKLKESGADIGLVVSARSVKWKLQFKVGNRYVESKRSLRKTGRLLRALRAKDKATGKLIYDTPDKVKMFIYSYLIEKITKDKSIKTNRWNVDNFNESNQFLTSEIARLKIVTGAARPARKAAPFVRPVKQPGPKPESVVEFVPSPFDDIELIEPEIIKPVEMKGQFKERTLSRGESPTGLRLYVDATTDPELAKKPPRYITYWHGDRLSIESTLASGILANVQALRKSGINAILLIPEYETSKSVKADDKWDNFAAKFDNLVAFCNGNFATGGKFDFTAFSGGYRAVANILGGSKNVRSIASINLLDATFPDSGEPIAKRFIEYIRAGGRGKIVTGAYINGRPEANGRTRKEGKKIADALGANMGKGKYDYVETELEHSQVNKTYLASAVAFAGQSLGQPVAQEARPRKVVERVERPVRKNTDVVLSEPVEAKMRILNNGLSKEALSLIGVVNIAREKMVTFTNEVARYKKQLRLKESPYNCLQLARKFAKAYGYDIFVDSGYRGRGEQKELWDKSSQDGVLTAAPGKSQHNVGTAVDCALYDPRTRKRLEDKESRKLLEKYMNMAGFVRYTKEWWHFEVGSRQWQKVMEKAGYFGDLANNG